MKPRTPSALIIGVSLFIVLFNNDSFFTHLLEVYPFNSTYAPFVISQGLVFFLFMVLFFSLLSWRYITKPLLISILIIAALQNYFMQTYNIMIDKTMIENTVDTAMFYMADHGDLWVRKDFICMGFLLHST